MIKRILIGVVCAMAAGGQAFSAGTDAIFITCSGPDSAVRTQICEALQSVVQNDNPDADVLLGAAEGRDAALQITFTLIKHGRDFAIGQLAWQDHKGHSETGPELEIAAMDTGLRPSILTDFATDLIVTANLPETATK